MNGTIFLNTGYHYFTIVITIGLQLVSCFTTFNGTNYYFGKITKPNFLAPITVTFLIQGSLILLSNTMKYKNKMNLKKGFAIFLMCTISIFFSYIGLVNTVIPPNKEMKKNYEDFYKSYENIEKIYNAQSSTFDSFEEYIDEKYRKLNNKLTTKSADLVNIIDIQPDNTNEKSINKKNSDGSSVSENSNTPNKEKADNKGIKENIDDAIDKLNSAYNEVEFKQLIKTTSEFIENENSDKEKEIEKLDKNPYVKQFIDKYNNAIDKLDDREITEIQEIKNFTTLYYLYDSFKNQDLKINSYEEIIDSLKKNNKKLDETNINDLLLISNNIQENIEKFENSKIYTYDFSNLQMGNEEVESLKDKANKAKEIRDFNLQAVLYLISDLYQSKAISMLIAAFFIDGMTIIIAFLFEIPKYCILYIRSRKNLIYEEEEIIEKLFEVTSPLNESFIDNVKSLRDKLVEFLNLFEFSSETAFEKGYSLVCSKEKLNNFISNNRSMMSFVVFIKVCHYLFYDENKIFFTDKNDSPSYYLRTKFELWIADCISSLTQYIENSNLTNENKVGDNDG